MARFPEKLRGNLNLVVDRFNSGDPESQLFSLGFLGLGVYGSGQGGGIVENRDLKMELRQFGIGLEGGGRRGRAASIQGEEPGFVPLVRKDYPRRIVGGRFRFWSGAACQENKRGRKKQKELQRFPFGFHEKRIIRSRDFPLPDN